MSDKQHKVDVSFIWKITDDVLRDTFKKNEIGDVLLPFVVIRRLDCLLDSVNKDVREANDKFKEKVSEEKLIPILQKAAGGLKFYNTSMHTLQSLKDEPRYIEINFNNYINGFNPLVRGILESFQFDKIIARLVKNRLLFEMIDAISNIDLHSKKVDNHTMGSIFEELIRISNDQSNETAGEHFTPRDVIALMNTILYTSEKEELCKSGIIRSIFDPACGTGGMVNLGKNFILNKICNESKNKPTILTYGQELNEQSYAIANSEALITGEDSNNVKHGNTFSNDQFQGNKFHYMMANPPYGVTWKKDADFIRNEALNPFGRFNAGLQRTSDGQLLFLQHMISKMEPNGSKIAVVTNGSPLFTGDAGSGESEIRKWIIENDLLDCIIALPKDLFYNTGISTFIWFLSNKKETNRKGKVQLINASLSDNKEAKVKGFCQSNPKSLGNKRNEISEKHIQRILELYSNFEESKYSKIFNNDDFGYYQLTIEQPLLDKEGDPIYNKNFEKKPDSKKRDKEVVPIKADVEEYFNSEVLPHVPDAWIDHDKTRIGYEINFSKYFYEHKALVSSSDIKTEMIEINKDISNLLNELLG